MKHASFGAKSKAAAACATVGAYLMPTLAHRPEATRHDLGQGIYSLAELRSFLAFSGERGDAARALPWLTGVLNPVPHTPHAPDYSFSDLISLFVVRELLKKGVRPRAIHTAERELRERWKTDRPFVSDEIKTDGRHVYWNEEPLTGQIEAADLRGQQVMLIAVKERLTKVRYQAGAAAYWTPMSGVLVDPRVQFGEPVVKGTRVTTEVLADAVGHFGLPKAANRLGVPLDAAWSAVTFQKKLSLVS